MSETNDPSLPPPPSEGAPAAAEQPAPYVIPVRYVSAPPPGAAPGPQQAVAPKKGSIWMPILALVLALAVGVSMLLALVASKLPDLAGVSSADTATEQFHSGKRRATNKIAIIRVDGVIMEGANAFVRQQIEHAAADDHVKAIVLRVNSPGGTITGSDDLYRRLTQVRDGTFPQQKGGKKPIVVSMGAMATSGGYYISMPAETLFAEPTTITGSIGVYAAFPNISGLANTYGFGMEVIKAGDVKDSGSMFKKMTPQERQLWQDMVDNAYKRFTEIVEKGRQDEAGKSKLDHRLTAVVVRKNLPLCDADGKPVLEDGKPKTFEYVRKLADGGIWTAQQALEFKLVDEIGYLEDAIKKTAKTADLGENYRAITYERPQTLASMLLGVQAPRPGQQQLTNGNLAAGATPRLWYLGPQSEMAGVLEAVRSGE